MASLFESVSDDFLNVGRQVQELSWTAVIMYCLIAVVVVLIVMMLLGKKVSSFFSWLNIFRSPRSRAMIGSKTFWKSGSVGAMHNLIVPEDQMMESSNTQYTYHVDILLANSRNLSGIEGPYRHIVHRGSDELYSGGPNTPVATGSETRTQLGLPTRMNPGIFLDPNTNDILIFVDTKGRNGDTYRESLRVPDIPLGKPFRLSVAVFGNVLEISLNCHLETTKVLNGTPRPVENILYGLCGPSAAEASVQDMIVWPFAVNSQDMLAMCPKRFPAFAPAVSSSCAVSSRLIQQAAPSPSGRPDSRYTFTCST